MKPMIKSIGTFAGIGTLLVAMLPLASCHKKTTDQSTEIQSVDVALPLTDSIVVTETYPGELTPDKALEVVARVDGYIVGKYFNDGDYVKEGQTLFSIEPTMYANAVAEAEATLATAQSTAEYSRRQYEAMKKAYQSQAVSQMDVIKAESAMNEAEASIKSAQAQLKTARTNLGYCTVKALVSGHVAAPNVIIGQYVAGAGSPVVLTTIYDDSTVSANFSVEEMKYQQILNNKVDAPIDFSDILVTFNDTLPHVYHGHLDYVAPDVNTSTGTIRLKVKMDNPYGELKAGMYSLVHLPTEVLPQAILIKDASISTDQAGKYVYVVNDSNKVVSRQIEVGSLYNDSMRVVLSGLQPTDRYVTRALLKVKPGMEVKPALK